MEKALTDPNEIVSYKTAHNRMYAHHGQPYFCEHCKKDESGWYEWAHIHDALMNADRINWLRLCRSCHMIYDQPTRGHLSVKDIRFIQKNNISGINGNTAELAKRFKVTCSSIRQVARKMPPYDRYSEPKGQDS